MSNGIFDEAVAARYDSETAARFAPEVLGPVVDTLAELADGGPVLELAIGTGRVALPLAARGVEVRGIELSEPMAARLRAKPGGAQIPVTIGDMATTRLGCTFRLVYLVYNTITNLLTQDEQVACFANAAAHLRPGGLFLIEVAVPALRRLAPGERFVTSELSDGHICVDEYDVAGQRLVSHHYRVAGGRCEMFRSPHRYAWPAEYDLMARLAGLSLRYRWANWRREPFTSESSEHISVWAKS
jgi:SAM-dependent methyltransferase